jgi:pimeloyl-ACP methyl ester carboxylesterase
VTGDGPAVILVCGLSQRARQWHDAGYVAALADRYRVVTIDPLGHGASDKPHIPEMYGTADVVGDLLAVADAEGIATATWWGFSRGAWMVRRLCATNPDRLNAVVLGSFVKTFGPDDFPTEPIAELFRTPGGLERVWAAMGLTDPALVATGVAENDCEALACAMEGPGDAPVELDLYAVPVLSYKGSLETYYDEDVTELASSAAEFHEVADATHVAAFARAAEVLSFVEPFIDRVNA